MPVDKTADRLISGRDNSFVVSSSADKKLKIYQMEIREKIDTTGRPFKGPKDAPVTIAVFSDYQCPYCGRLDTLLRQVLEKNPKTVKIVFKNFPLKFHAYAKNAAVAALAAYDQGKFAEFHEKLYANISTQRLQNWEIVKETNLDMERFNRKLQDSSSMVIIKRDLAEGERIGVNSTPTIYVNGKLNDRSLKAFRML
jgi:protein-disulfide isomerase